MRNEAVVKINAKARRLRDAEDKDRGDPGQGEEEN